MRPSNNHRRVVEVNASKTWEAVIEHRIYSCPVGSSLESGFGASSVLLTSRHTDRRVILDVEAVETCNPGATDFLCTVPIKFHASLNCYIQAVRNTHGILDVADNYRFYFLSHEPWPAWLQDLTSPEKCFDMEWKAVRSVWSEADQFFAWPHVGVLLWPGCIRNTNEHIFPEEIRNHLSGLGIECDRRSNGPAIAAFLAAGGRRPRCGDEGWPIHHIYDETAPILGVPPIVHPQVRSGLHAVQKGHSFTHSAGLVATHPVTHSLAHQSTLLKWLLRREAYIRFGFDPDGAFNH